MFQCVWIHAAFRKVMNSVFSNFLLPTSSLNVWGLRLPKIFHKNKLTFRLPNYPPVFCDRLLFLFLLCTMRKDSHVEITSQNSNSWEMSTFRMGNGFEKLFQIHFSCLDFGYKCSSNFSKHHFLKSFWRHPLSCAETPFEDKRPLGNLKVSFVRD